MKQVTVFGGSFNPIHNGHIALARAVLDNQLSDEVWLMVSPQNPLKEQQDLMPEKKRLKLAQLAVSDEQNIVVSDFEFKMPRPSFTWKTLRALCTEHPDTQFSLLIGGDNWLDFHKWANHEELLSNYTIIIYPRPNYTITEEDLPANVRLLKNAPQYSYSSTEIRQRLHNGTDISPFVPAAVIQALI